MSNHDSELQIWLAGRFKTDAYFSGVVDEMQRLLSASGLRRAEFFPDLSESPLWTDVRNVRVLDTAKIRKLGVAEPEASLVSLIAESSRRSALFASPHKRRAYAVHLISAAKEWASSFDGRTQVVIWSETPHFAWDLCCHFALRDKGVKQIILRRTALRHLTTFWDGFDSQARMMRVQTPDTELANLRFRLASESTVSELVHNGPIAYSRSKFPNAYSRSKFPNGLKGRRKSLWSRVRKVTRRVRRRLSHLQEPYFNLPAVLSLVVILRRMSQIRMRQCFYWLSIRNFDSELEASLLGTNVIYFPLQVRPERTVLPEALVGANQFDILRSLVKSLPGGWKIVVKEHPNHIDMGLGDVRKVLQRDLRLYLLLATSRQIVWIDALEPACRLYRIATIVFTGTGSAAWEACSSGIPAVVSGRTWHETHELTWSWRTSPSQLPAFAAELRRLISWANYVSETGVNQTALNSRFLYEVAPFLASGASGAEVAGLGNSSAPTKPLAFSLVLVARTHLGS